MAIDEDEIHHLIELRETTNRRLRELRVQKANFGLTVPTYITIDIKQAEKDIAVLDARLQTVQPSEKVAAAVGPTDTQTILLDFRLKQLAEMFGELVGEVRRIADQVLHNEAVADQRYESEQQVRVERQEEHDSRLTVIESGLESNNEQVLLLASRIGGVRWLIIGLIVVAVGVGVALWYSWHGGR